jgi:hypothetical protein
MVEPWGREQRGHGARASGGGDGMEEGKANPGRHWVAVAHLRRLTTEVVVGPAGEMGTISVEEGGAGMVCPLLVGV